MKTLEEGIIAIAAVLLMLFIALVAPAVAVVISNISLAAFIIYKFVQKNKRA